MKRTGWPVIGLALLMMVACKAQPDKASENNIIAPQNALAGNDANVAVVAKPQSSDQSLRKQLPGSWVYLQKPPAPKPDEWACETDNFLSLGSDQSYAEYDATGLWTVESGTLILTATTALTDSDEENGSEQPINPPRVERMPIEEINGDLLRLRIRDHVQWMFRCPEVEKG